MKRQLVLAVLTLAPSLAWATSYEIDPAHSAANFTVRHMMITNVKGSFYNLKGKVELDDKDPAKSSAEIVMDATAIDTKEPKRDADLKSSNFFDVAKYPTITFKSKRVTPAGKGFKVVGDLTLKGVTKEITVDVDQPTPEVKDPWGNTKRGVAGTTTINRKDFGLNWNAALEGGGVVVGDEVKLTVDLELAKVAPKAPKK